MGGRWPTTVTSSAFGIVSTLLRWAPRISGSIRSTSISDLPASHPVPSQQPDRRPAKIDHWSSNIQPRSKPRRPRLGNGFSVCRVAVPHLMKQSTQCSDVDTRRNLHRTFAARYWWFGRKEGNHLTSPLDVCADYRSAALFRISWQRTETLDCRGEVSCGSKWGQSPSNFKIGRKGPCKR